MAGDWHISTRVKRVSINKRLNFDCIQKYQIMEWENLFEVEIELFPDRPVGYQYG